MCACIYIGNEKVFAIGVGNKQQEQRLVILRTGNTVLYLNSAIRWLLQVP